VVMDVALVVIKEFVSHVSQDFFIILQQQHVNILVLHIFLETITQINVNNAILHVFHVISVIFV
jgi:hypothetical protein